MELVHLYFLCSILLLVLMTALWLLSLVLKNSSIVDIFWGMGFVALNFVAYYFSQHTTLQTVLTLFVTLWGTRLSTHIFLRNKGKPEDFRYAQWREEHGKHWRWISFFKVFLLQGVLLFIIITPLLVFQGSLAQQFYPGLYFAGIAFWLIGFFFESVGDYQLRKFKADLSNSGKVLTSGLWRYTRHPNYFGDSLQWWGFWCFALGSGAWWTIFSPLLMTVLLLRVSGVTLLEKSLKSRPGYEDYIRKTNTFFPWIPKT